MLAPPRIHGVSRLSRYATGPELMRPPSGSLERSWLRMQPPRQAKKACKKFWCPNPPNRGTATRREEGRILQGKTCVCRAMQKQGSIVHSLRDFWRATASCAWRMWCGLSSSHISGGHWNQARASNERRRAVPRRGHGTQFLTQQRHAGPSAKCRGVSTQCLSPTVVYNRRA